MKKYEVTLKAVVGSCENDLFRKMAEKGDLVSNKLSDMINTEVKILGYAECNIKTADKDFDINYFDTEEYGLISSSSQIFLDSVKDYYGEVERVRLTEVKTGKGKTFKAVPVLTKGIK